MNKYLELVKNVGITLGLLIIATLTGGLFEHLDFHIINIALVYILAIFLTARYTKGYFYGILATILAFLSINYLFTAPYYSFKINDPSNIVTVAIMTFTATITSALTSKFKQAAHVAHEKEIESNALYQMISYLTEAKNSEELAATCVNVISEIFECPAGFILFSDKNTNDLSFIQRKNNADLIHRKIDNPLAFKQAFRYCQDEYIAGEEFYDYPVYSEEHLLAVLRIPCATAAELNRAQSQLLHSIVETISIVLDRFQSIEEQTHIKEEARQERYRSNLLRAISHDLRTPLSGILGTSEMIMDMSEETDPRFDLAKNIYDDAEWLRSLVENILSLTKVQEGQLQVKKQYEAIEEIIGAALAVHEKRMKGLRIKVDMPDKVIMVPMDARLITQVLVNLLDNATKYSSEGQEIKITVKEDEVNQMVEVAVLDEGPGIKEKALPFLFQMFYTADNHEKVAQKGVGLGLSICQSIIEAHNGHIKAENRPEGGARFSFTLPLGDDNHEKQ